MPRIDLPSGNRTTPRRTALISGASIAGPALAFWLNRYGFEVTVVERADALRGGGYPVDVRGTALEVVRRMGILPRLRDAHIDLRRLTFLDEDGGEVASLAPHTVTGGVAGQDLEVPRGELTRALHTAVRDDVEFLFGDSIDTLDTLDRPDHGVDVTFRRGGSRTFDLVFGADGLHSHTRRLLFGPEEQFHSYLGHCFAGFTMRNTLGLCRETVLWNAPGRAAALYAAGDNADEVHAFLNLTRPTPPFDAFRNPAAQRALLTEAFAESAWQIPEMLTALHIADDLFFDVVSQIRMPRWSNGRAALVGDAAYAPSLLTGQGTSLALVGSYMLAASLAARDHTTGFAAYEHDTRAFVTLNQDQAGKGAATLFPATARALEQRNRGLRELSTIPPQKPGRPAHSALTLPEFTDVA
ncbi:FAD-dependent monooxygenase [Streptomyces sp. C11-1]|uniref:FAD-dependent monooxygenase n=1 Tax=Streptomyces durocortorensis TaxID=2811104 RepID=A0ABY9W8R4_9ACTN|nr:FAD-dependent monooxygenase [Streptomyces durocortorensis]WNF31225.1 FAD-dependent monooxygenase [Streptomyces durocortorensis]